MILPECFELDWIAKIRDKYTKTDPGLIEKTIYAFEMLGLLAENGLDFIFKGGTSMLLLMDNPRRLSIDIDILSAVEEDALKQTVKDSVFHQYALDERETGDIPKSHHKFFYYSKVNQREDYTLLDVVNSANPYQKLIETDIRSDFFITNKEIKIRIPTIDCLLGDKLTAFAPNTIGVPYNKNKSMVIIKQLIDVDDLFMASDHIDDMLNTYRAMFEIENQLRENRFTIEDVWRIQLRLAI